MDSATLTIGLTRKQHEAARLANDGLTHQQIADRMGIPSRHAVTQLLQRARNAGLTVSRRARTRAPRPMEIPMSQIGGAAKRYVDSLVA